MKDAQLALEILYRLVSKHKFEIAAIDLVKKAIEIADTFVMHIETDAELQARIEKKQKEQLEARKAAQKLESKPQTTPPQK